MCWTICYTTIPTHMPRPLHLSESYCWDQTFCRRPKPPPHAFVPATAVGAWPKCSPIAVRLILSDWPTAHRIRMRLCAFVYGPWPLKLLFMLLKFFQLCLSFCLGEKESHLPGRGWSIGSAADQLRLPTSATGLNIMTLGFQVCLGQLRSIHLAQIGRSMVSVLNETSLK